MIRNTRRIRTLPTVQSHTVSLRRHRAGARRSATGTARLRTKVGRAIRLCTQPEVGRCAWRLLRDRADPCRRAASTVRQRAPSWSAGCACSLPRVRCHAISRDHHRADPRRSAATAKRLRTRVRLAVPGHRPRLGTPGLFCHRAGTILQAAGPGGDAQTRSDTAHRPRRLTPRGDGAGPAPGRVRPEANRHLPHLSGSEGVAARSGDQCEFGARSSYPAGQSARSAVAQGKGTLGRLAQHHLTEVQAVRVTLPRGKRRTGNLFRGTSRQDRGRHEHHKPPVRADPDAFHRQPHSSSPRSEEPCLTAAVSEKHYRFQYQSSYQLTPDNTNDSLRERVPRGTGGRRTTAPPSRPCAHRQAAVRVRPARACRIAEHDVSRAANRACNRTPSSSQNSMLGFCFRLAPTPFFWGSYPTGVDYRGEERGHAAAKTICFQGSELGAGESTRIRAIVAKHAPKEGPQGATLRELATLVCQEWDWRRANGELRLCIRQNLLGRLSDRWDRHEEWAGEARSLRHTGNRRNCWSIRAVGGRGRSSRHVSCPRDEGEIADVHRVDGYEQASTRMESALGTPKTASAWSGWLETRATLTAGLAGPRGA